ncbi:MAG: HU family DNA-binding protein [Bacteroidales bacterium]|nr:HU family DNA-binding protein [Bacteroidales bacterium]
MIYKEFTSELAKRVGRTNKETTAFVGSLLDVMSKRWAEGDSVTILNIGTFEVKKKTERVSVHPTTKQRMLIPPKLVLTFRPSQNLKDFISDES